MAKLSAHEQRGMLFGLVAVAMFSFTLPFTRLAVAELDPAFIAFGRAAVAAMLAAVWLRAVKAPWPSRASWKPLAIIALGCVIGFPWLTSIAMRTLPATHGAIVTGLLPLVTALMVRLRGRERPTPAFWLCACLGSALVIGFALMQGGGSLHAADLLMIGAMLAAAVGYAEGAQLSADMGGERVICWALLLAAPLSLGVSGWQVWQEPAAFRTVSATAWAGFAYTCAFSMFIAFFFWYRGMAMGGVARVSQVQLLQPFLTLLAAAAVLGESLRPMHAVFAMGVVAIVALGRQAQVLRPGVK